MYKVRIKVIRKANYEDLSIKYELKELSPCPLKENDELINVSIYKEDTLFITHNGLYLRFKTAEIPTVGAKASGVKGINLKEDYVIYAGTIKEEDE